MAMPSTLEPAIPTHLRTERTIPSKLPEDYQPPFPAYSARFSEDVKDLVMAIIGVQHENRETSMTDDFKKIVGFVEKPLKDSRPRFWEAATVMDTSGFFNEVAIVYWKSTQYFKSWKADSGFDAWWKGLEPGGESGWFFEVLLPSVDRFETVFSDDVVPEGAAHMREASSGQIAEHVYWGSMRDRLPASQTDYLNGDKWSAHTTANGSTSDSTYTQDSRSRRVKISGRKNLAIIRSGQDWSNTTPHEREKYLETMHPVLIRGMDFLRDQGEEVGCFSCRFMDVVDKCNPGSATEKTFGLAYFDDLASLEGWSKSHKTHLDIFGRFLQYAKELQGQVSLRLFHEVMVLKPEQQILEYVGCHDKTGMLASL
jgi:hypothetical protein